MPRKRAQGRPRKVEKRAADRAQKANRRARLQEIGLVEFRGWVAQEELAYLRRDSRLKVANAEYLAVLREEGMIAAEPFAERIREVQEQNAAEVAAEYRKKAREQAEAERQAWRKKLELRNKEVRVGPPVFSF